MGLMRVARRAGSQVARTAASASSAGALSSFGAEGFNWVNPRSAARGDEAGD